MKLSRKHFVAGAARACVPFVALRFPAGAAEFTYRFASPTEPTHPVSVYSEQAIDRINRESGGRLEIKAFVGGVLGGGNALVTQVRLGSVELCTQGDNILQTIAPAMGLSAVPFAFGGYADAWKAVDGPLGKYMRAGLAKANIYAFGRKFDIGMRQMFTGTRPIEGPDDLKGLKMRTAQSPVDVAMYKALSATPTPLNGMEIYTGLQTHLVDGADLPLFSGVAMRLSEVQRYVGMTHHSWTGYTVFANADAWRRLPKDLQEITERNFDASARSERDEIVRLEQKLAATLKGQGLSFTQPDDAAFKNVLRSAGFFAQVRDTFGADAWSELERAAGRLA